LAVMPAKEPDDRTLYLGYPMPKGRLLCMHYDFLIEKLKKKFSG
jgi:hypothetical protein